MGWSGRKNSDILDMLRGHGSDYCAVRSNRNIDFKKIDRKKSVIIGLTSVLVSFALTGSAIAVPREAGRNDGAILKLQGMVKSLSAERDQLVNENVNLATELDKLKTAHKEAIDLKEQLGSELSAQKASSEAVRSRLDETHSKLSEVIEKYKQLTQEKNELGRALSQLKASHEATEHQLHTCGEHNVKLYEAGKELLERYENKGTFSGLLQDEPFLGFQSVEMQNIVQEYQDKVDAGRFKEVTPDTLQ